MAKKKKEVVEKTTEEQVKQPVVEETSKVDESKFESANDDSVVKVDLNKPPIPKEEKNETKEDNADDSGVVAESKDAEPTQEQEEVQPEGETQEAPILEEVTEEEVAEVEEQIEEAVAEAEATGKPLPENIQKLIDFMEETGGDLNDYVKLNQDYSKLDDESLLKEYYRQTKSHLNEEEINFLMEDAFSYDEEIDDERDVRRKKLALKEQVASAKSHLDGQKSKYYEDIKAGSKLTQEQQKAMDFFNRYNKEAEENEKVSEQMQSTFIQKTDKVFNDKFKGFEYNIGEKKFRFNVKNAKEVRDTQVDINNFVGKFLDENHAMKDAKGYHKSIFTAMNADAIANHFYEQGRADAMKNSVAKAKNIDMNPRQAHGEIDAGGMKFKVLGDNSSDFKFKIKNKNK